MIADPFAAFERPVVIDGGLATELEHRGADLRDSLWSARVLLEEPSLVVDVHRAYIDAGADVVITASYQASYDGLARRGLDRDAATALLQSSVALAREAAGDHGTLVAASIGPFGAVLANGAEYTGEYGLGAPQAARRALRAFHRPRAEALWAARPDLLAIETIPSAVEAEALAGVLAEIGDAPAWVSFTCADDQHLADGSSFDDAVAIADATPQVVAIGVNCTAPPHAPGLVRRAAAATRKPVVAYPNRGGIWDATTKSWTGDDVPEGFGPLAAELRTAGARAIGGCCGTGPSDIEEIAELLQTPDPKG